MKILENQPNQAVKKKIRSFFGIRLPPDPQGVVERLCVEFEERLDRRNFGGTPSEPFG